MAQRSDGNDERWALERERMIALQLYARGIDDARVLAAVASVPREHFVSPDLIELAYADRPLPIGGDQTISQPYIVALTLQALELKGDEKALDVGTGSGYAAALLSRLVREVYSIERIERLAQEARERLGRLGYPVSVQHGDGTLGFAPSAPYDAIAVAATAPSMPKALTAQLALGGRMVIPVRDDNRQILMRVRRTRGDQLVYEPLEEVRFVPLIGAGEE